MAREIIGNMLKVCHGTLSSSSYSSWLFDDNNNSIIHSLYIVYSVHIELEAEEEEHQQNVLSLYGICDLSKPENLPFIRTSRSRAVASVWWSSSTSRRVHIMCTHIINREKRAPPSSSSFHRIPRFSAINLKSCS